MLTPEQCRAGRALLNWSQTQLAENARVSRATVADFESNTRRPIVNNLRSMADAMYAAGVEFISDEPPNGVGVRFRTMKLQYTKNFRRDFNRDAVFWLMEFEGRKVECIIPEEIIADYHRRNFSTDAEVAEALSDMMHVVLSVVEKRLNESGYVEEIQIRHSDVGV